MLAIRRPIAIFFALALALSVFAPAGAYHQNGTHDFADDAFGDRWGRTDWPVSEEQVDRTWMWGPEPYTDGFLEPYIDAPDEYRLVQYFDKSRMEINDPDGDDADLWHVTNGRLVVEMVDGKIQLGDDQFDESPDPADIPIAGDPDDPYGPSYADISAFELRDVDARDPGTVIDEHLAMASIESSEEYAAYGVTAAENVPETDHTVADVFWDFMNSEGVIAEAGEFTEGRLFPNAYYATGYPITEAYWATVQVAGVTHDVLWQCFERRCLTYTPDYEPGWQVEAGHVGQHYYEWRYDIEAAETTTAQVFLVAIDDPDAGTPINGESLVGVYVQIPDHDHVASHVFDSLNELFRYEHGELYNAWSESIVIVDSVTVVESFATVHLVGDVILISDLDRPRLMEQLRHTAMQFDDVDDAIGLLHGGPLVEPAAMPTTGVLAIFEVNLEQFRVWVTDEQVIDDLLALEAGDLDGYFPAGPVHRGSSVENEPPYNDPWSWHLDPQQTELVDEMIEECLGGSPSTVEMDLDRFVDEVGVYCPDDAKIVEIRDFRDD